jgi:hypothetical protein
MSVTLMPFVIIYENQLLCVKLYNMHSSLNIRVIGFREKIGYIACVRQMRNGYVVVVESLTEELLGRPKLGWGIILKRIL